MGMDALNRVVRHLRGNTAAPGEVPTDSELLQRYRTRRDEAAFEAIVRRHGPMVLGVCRRILGNHADAEDAFQATFLVLVRKAGSIRGQGMVSNWLYGVAQHTALKAKAMQCKRRAKEKEAAALPRHAAAEEVWRQAQALVDDALARLADRYRVPIVLCDLEGRTIKEAARELGWPQGTVATRLTRGRAQLARRLAAAGLTLSAGAVTTLLAPGVLAAQVPAALVLATVRAAGLFALGNTAASGVVSATALALTQGVLNAMLLSKLKVASAVVLVVAVLGIGVGARLRAAAGNDRGDDGEPGIAAQQAPEPRRGGPKKTETPRDDRAALMQRIEALERTVERLTTEVEKSRKLGLSRTSRGDTVEPPPPPVKLELKIFKLRNADASEVAATLKQLFGPDEQGRGGFTGPDRWALTRTPRIAAHQSTNSVLAQGTAEELQTIEAVLIQLDEQAQNQPKKTLPPTPLKDELKKPKTSR